MWIHKSDSLIYLKEQGSAYSSTGIAFSIDMKIPERLLSGKTLCVDTNHLGERLIMHITDYKEGCIPLRIDNYCRSISIFLKQK